LWKTPTKAVKTVVKPKRLAFAVGAGAGTYKLVEWLESKSEAIAKFFENNPEKDSALVSGNIYNIEDKVILDLIIEKNPTIFLKDFKAKSFKMIVNKPDINGRYDVEYYLINNDKYFPVDLTTPLKVKKK
jgi:hypothetical protein